MAKPTKIRSKWFYLNYPLNILNIHDCVGLYSEHTKTYKPYLGAWTWLKYHCSSSPSFTSCSAAMTVFILSQLLSVSLTLSPQTCRLTSQWYGRSQCILRGRDPPRLWPGQTGLRSCNSTWNVPFVFVLFHFSCWKGGKFLPLHLLEWRKTFSWQQKRQFIHKKQYT